MTRVRVLLGMAAAVLLGVGQVAPPPLAAAPATGQRAPVVRTHDGDVQGVVEYGVFAYKGIPYAAPPTGRLRWREPSPATPWRGVRNGATFGNACIQPTFPAAAGGDVGPQSEDCLYLNVWTPQPGRSAGLPVMVWIHGGAYIFGAGSVPSYNGAPLASRGAVFVTINYRLGQLGFFAHPALDREHPGGPVNFGLLDQIAALRWVQRNIAQFGGDPGTVTILGESAGAKSVMALFASPLARGLFHRGIAESTYAVPDATRQKALEVGANVATAVGLNGAGATAAELRAVPASRFRQLTGQNLSTAPVPIAGDAVLPRSIQAAFAAGQEAPVPLIIGSNSDEGVVAEAFGINPGDVIRRLGAAGVLLHVLYPGVRDDDELGRLVVRDLVFTADARWVADRHSGRAPTWRYYFDYTAVNERAERPNGVPHGGEIVYVLDTVGIPGSADTTFVAADRRYARRVSEYWFQFARTGTPASSGGPAWPNHTATQDRTMVFGTTIAVQANFMRARLNAFIDIATILGRILNR